MITFDNPSYPIWKAGFDAGAESNRAAIAELVGVLETVLAISDRKHDAWDEARALITKHQQPTTTKEQ